MTKNEYNGWHNYETWLVNLWLDNDGNDAVVDAATNALQTAIDDDESDIRESAIASMSDWLESFINDCYSEQMPQNGLIADLLSGALSEINWHELAAHYINDIDLFSAGFNMPGYMPDNAPCVFIDADDALEYIKELALNDDSMDESAKDIIDDWQLLNNEFGQTIGNYHYFVTRI
jgi:hypothetical protein